MTSRMQAVLWAIKRGLTGAAGLGIDDGRTMSGRHIDYPKMLIASALRRAGCEGRALTSAS